MFRLGALAPFRHRSFRFQWPADCATSWAFEMETIILGWYVLVETNSVLLLTLYGALIYGGTLVAPLFGLASDRIGHRVLLSGMRTLYAAVACTLTVLVFAGLLNPVIVLCLAAVSGIARSSDMGLRGALIADSVPPEALTASLGIGRTTADVARIAGALSGAALFAALGMGPAFVAITLFYAVGACFTWQVRRPASMPPPAPVVRASPWGELREGLAYVWNTPRLLALVWFAFLVNFAVFPLTNGLLPYVAREIYSVGQTGLGYLVASVAFGALVGSVAMTRSGIRIGLPRLMLAGSVIWHILVLGYAQMQSLAWGVTALFLCGVAQSVTMVPHTVLLLRGASERFRGRVMGVRMLAIYSLPLGLLLSGVLIPLIGFHATASLYALTGLAFTAVIGLRWRAALWQARGAEDSV
ncbi:MAG: MFS transporter [Alphaproteobacteria bacterium]|nr:MFS transporter [Alphaproteobacteria bacterium]